MPCARASPQVIRPFPSSSYRASGSRPAPWSAAGREAGRTGATAHSPITSAVDERPASTRSKSAGWRWGAFDRQVARGLGVDLSRQEAAGAQGRDRVGAFASMGRSRKGGARARLRPAPPLRRSCGTCLCHASARGFACACAGEAGTKPSGENGTGSCRRKCDGSAGSGG